jgi:hypothetical protein
MITVTTKQHIIEDNNYSNCCGYSSLEGDYSNLDANSPKNEIQRFQAWMNAEKSIPLSGGTWDNDTMATYQMYATEYETGYNKDFDKKNAEFDSGKSKAYTKGGKGGGTFKDTVATSKKIIKGSKGSIEKAIEDAKPIKKGMSDTAKILIGLGIALVLGTTIYFIAKR